MQNRVRGGDAGGGLLACGRVVVNYGPTHDCGGTPKDCVDDVCMGEDGGGGVRAVGHAPLTISLIYISLSLSCSQQYNSGRHGSCTKSARVVRGWRCARVARGKRQRGQAHSAARSWCTHIRVRHTSQRGKVKNYFRKPKRKRNLGPLLAGT